MNQRVISPTTKCDAPGGCRREAAARLVRNKLKLQMATCLPLKGMPEGNAGGKAGFGGRIASLEPTLKEKSEEEDGLSL